MMFRILKPFLPAVLLALLSLWSGTLPGGASSLGAAATHAILLSSVLLAGSYWRDPLGLGNLGRWLLAALLMSAVLSWSLSPVERAGRVGVLLLPAFLLLPAAVASCWSDHSSRRRGLAALSAVTLSVTLVAIASSQLLSSARTAMPLGHHTLLAGWLVLLLPLSIVPAGSAGPGRWLALAAGMAGGAALFLSGSSMATIAVAAQLLGAASCWRKARRWLVPAGLIALALALPRMARIAGGIDPSAGARFVYLAGGWRGFLERPILGWGPGAVPWTVAEFLRPVPGVNPPSEILGDLHCLPVQLTYELGAIGVGLTLALGMLFLVRRWRELGTDPEPAARSAALLGLLGGAVYALGSAPLVVAALPAAAAVVAGATLPPRSLARRSWTSRSSRVVIGYAAVTALLLVPADLAHYRYDLARSAEDPLAALSQLDRASRLDPDFPLYHARAAWLMSDLEGPAVAALRALEAAELAHALAPFWLAAGTIGTTAGSDWAAAALERAYRLDSLSPLAAWHLMASSPDGPRAVSLGSQAVKADPRLLTAPFWRTRPELLAKVLAQSRSSPPTVADGARPRILALTMDTVPAVSLSLYAFRRSPWPSSIAGVEVEM